MTRSLATSTGRRGEQSAGTVEFRVTGWAAEAPGLRSPDQWLAWAKDRPVLRATDTPAAELPMMLRRRLSPLAQGAARAMFALGAAAEARYVFCSRHGDFSRILALLKGMAAREPLSPTDFSMSVYNAIAGVLSIASGNGAGHTAVAAGQESFGEGMIEAISTVIANPGQPVVLAYFDEPLPSPYEKWQSPSETPLVVALALAPANTASPAISLALEPGSRQSAPNETGNQALDFLRFLLAGTGETLSLGTRMGWRWRHVRG